MSEYERVIKSGEHPNPNFSADIIGWKIYYNDGSVFSSKDGSWNSANSNNIVLVVLFYTQTYQTYISGVMETHNYRILLDEGRYFWRQIQNSIETFGQCEADDASMPINPNSGEVKTWNGGNNFVSIYNTAYLDNVWV